MPEHIRSRLLTLASALMLVTLVLAPIAVTPTPAQAKEFEIDGTIDCGRPSGKLCIPVGATIGIVTDQFSGKKGERVEVGMAMILEQRLKRSKTGQLLLDDPQGLHRAALFAEIQPLVAELAQLDPQGMSLEEKERLVDELFDRSIPREQASARDKLLVIAQNFKQDGRIRVLVDDQIAPPGLMVTEIRAYQDYSLPQGRPSGSQNHGQMTGDDSELGFCTDFVEEFLDFAKKRIEDRGKLELTNNEELFFELISELPNPCFNKGAERELTQIVEEWIVWNVKAVADELREELKERRRDRLERLQRFLARPGARALLIAIIKETILKPQPEGRSPFRNIIEERKR